MSYQGLLQLQFGANTGENYLSALGIFIVAVIILKVFQLGILRVLKRAAGRTKTDFDDVLIGMMGKIKPSFYLVIALYLSFKFLTFGEMASAVIDGLFIAVIAYQVIKILQDLIDYGAKKFIAQREDGEGTGDASAVKNISAILKIFLWILATLVVLSNWGINVTSLVAGLGIGGIAIALALQNILSDIFSSFSIFIDKPFVVGDFIIAGNDMGVVERIGIKTTRIKTLQGEELVVSNQELTNTRVRNFKKMEI